MDTSQVNADLRQGGYYEALELGKGKRRAGRDIVNSLEKVDLLHLQRLFSGTASGTRSDDLSRHVSRHCDRNFARLGCGPALVRRTPYTSEIR